jgi:hypothetical protein
MQEDVEAAIKAEIAQYRKFQDVVMNDEANILFNLLIETVAQKMIWAFTTNKDGDNINSWDEFCKVRGEIVARLQPIQEIRGKADMVNHLSDQLKELYNPQT